MKLCIFTFEGPPKNIVPFVWKLCLSKVVDVALLALDFSSWEVSAPKKVGIFKIIGSKGFKARKEKKTQIQAPKKYNPWYNPWKKIKFQKKRNYNYNAFFTKNVHTFFVCFSFFPFKKQESIYIQTKGTLFLRALKPEKPQLQKL